jgi:hypothetical protein
MDILFGIFRVWHAAQSCRVLHGRLASGSGSTSAPVAPSIFQIPPIPYVPIAVLAPASLNVRTPDANDTATMAARAPALIIARGPGQATVIKQIGSVPRRCWAAVAHRFSTTCCRVLSRRHPAAASCSGNRTKYPRRRAAISPPNTYMRRGLRCRGCPAPCVRAWRHRHAGGHAHRP